MGPGYSIIQVGLAFTTALVGSTLAALTSITIEQVIVRKLAKKHTPATTSIEYRLVPAMMGQFLVTIALFWIGKMSRVCRNPDLC